MAALTVTIGHGFELWFPGYLQWSKEYFNLGRVGITAFFLVSGYVIGLTLTKQTIRTFAIRRFWRLYPVYWLTTAIYVLTSISTGTWSGDYGLFVIILNVTMIQGFFSVASILTPAWTLGAELVFYVQSAAGKAVRLIEKSPWLGYAWLAILAAFAVLNAAFGKDFAGIGPLMLFTSSLGFSVFLGDKNGSREWVWLASSAIFLVPILGAVLLARPGSGEGWTPLAFGDSYLGGLVLFAVFYVARGDSFPRSMLWLGSVSYALYLIHVSVFALAASIGIHLGLALLIPSTAVSLVAAWLLHKYVEQPCVRLGRKLS